MDTTDVRMIADLAESIRVASPVEKDPESAGLIAHLVASQPDAVYFLVQTVLVQKLALEAVRTTDRTGVDRAPAPAPEPAIEQAAQRRGLAGFFGSRRGEATASAGVPGAAPAPAASGGSFLKTAAAGAAGVAGGVLLAQGISGLFAGEASPHAASRAEGWDDAESARDDSDDDGFVDDGFADDWSDA